MIELTDPEIAQVRYRLWRIQNTAGRSTVIYNQARMLGLVISKAERRKARENKQPQKHNAQ